MGDEPSLKQQLPFPYNQDLAQVLNRLNRRTEPGRQGLANEPVTAAFLAAAMRLVHEHVGPTDDVVTDTEGDGRYEFDRSLLGFLTQRAVAAEMRNNPDPFPSQGAVSTMRSIWQTQSDFIADLLNFAFWPAYYPESYQELRAVGAERLVSDTDVVEAVEDLTYRVAQSIEEIATFRLQLIAIASAGRNDEVRSALEGKYARAHALWKQVYGEFLRVRRMRLRDGMTLDEFTSIMTGMLEGSILRAISDPSTEILDHVEHRSLAGTAALAILNGCLEPVDAPDGRSLRESLADKVNGASS